MILLIRNAKVVGSTPIIGTIKIKLLRKILSFSHQKNYLNVTAGVSKFYQRRSILSTDQKGLIGLRSLYILGCRLSCTPLLNLMCWQCVQ
ncbi:hypothetical protein B9059_017410 [Enterobacter roggenkampii]|uniref:Uncharacterized protein n=1 Tax=Enterobacter roggenkampii TaxID=1812935 RepID=A0AAX1WNE7_9ENTR|nr:hypothetical protein B9059_017410 [Enterobacter roggenkampii]